MRKRLPSLCIVLASMLFLYACSSVSPYDPIEGGFLPRQDDLAASDEPVVISEAQALEDYDYMWTMLEDNVPYYTDIDENLALSGNSLERIKDNGRISIKSKYHQSNGKPISPKAYADIINHTLRDMHRYGHIMAHDSLYLLNMMQRMYGSGIHEEDAVSNNLYNIASNEKTVSFYQAIDDSNGQNETNNETSEARMKTMADSFDEYFRLEHIEDIPYVVIKSFVDIYADSDDYQKYASDRLGAFFLENKYAEHIIIDIRGNGGGNDAIWNEGIVSYLAAEPTTVFYVSGIHKTGYNSFLFNDDFPQSDKDSWRTALPGITDSVLDRFDLIIASETHREVTENFVGFNGKIWLLIDDKCYSSSESLIYFSQQSGFATTVGTQSKGSGVSAFGRPWIFALPNSGMLIYYDSSYGFNADGTCSSITGTMPDIITEGDALEACLQAIAESG